jgi:hypothetical protein
MMFTNGFEKIAKRIEEGILSSIGKSMSGAWKSAKPYTDGALHHLKSDRALRGAGLGAVGGAVTGATSKDEYGNYKGFDGAIGGAIKGGIAGGAAGAAWNRYKAGPAALGKMQGSKGQGGGLASSPKQSVQGKGNAAKKRAAEIKASAPAQPVASVKKPAKQSKAAKALGGGKKKGQGLAASSEAFKNV